MKAITKRLRSLRLDANAMSQRDTAIKARIPFTRYQHIENGYRTPDDKELEAIARALKCQPSDIVPSSQEVVTHG